VFVVKKVFKDENSITLVSINDKNYPPKTFTKKDFESQHISIDFRVIKLLRDE
jgi:phage repressor protein C with HTH and peptisase S24 domain